MYVVMVIFVCLPLTISSCTIKMGPCLVHTPYSFTKFSCWNCLRTCARRKAVNKNSLSLSPSLYPSPSLSPFHSLSTFPHFLQNCHISHLDKPYTNFPIITELLPSLCQVSIPKPYSSCSVQCTQTLQCQSKL